MLTGWYLLGNGTRAYSPCLMRFQSPDDLSPFGEGGFNSYGYCGQDPINYVDPTGNLRFFAWFARKLGLSQKSGTPKTVQKNEPPQQAAPGKTGKKKPQVSAGKVKTPARHGRVNDGNIKGGFWDDQSKGIVRRGFEPEKQPRTPVSSPSSEGKGSSLEAPSTGWQIMKERLKKPFLNEDARNLFKPSTSGEGSMFQSHAKAIGKYKSRSEEDMASVRENR
ncbi:hypothetical protein PS858_01369 [Pseudomonas fluorescens]|uniref:RHS repeat-associated core domain-containing protein n=2 Tax=Pseudomonas fluorescens TaxID=294 RepID=A0A5E7ICK5_PSEFL|nr:hypothetical protein PS704_03424 [Pseudomonas fluorescens]VVO72367.1 hypothetical protein PS858_01369 [Pseudomonas fluorescens]